jgi:uncharacterized cupredoxin-like copper-binding protein
VTAKNTLWDVQQIEGTQGEPLKIVVRNNDSVLHTFTIDALDIDARLGPHSETLVVIEPSAGTYGFFCQVPGHEQMAGLITIR